MLVNLGQFKDIRPKQYVNLENFREVKCHSKIQK